METPSSQGEMPAPDTIKDEEKHGLQGRHVDEPVIQAPSAKTSILLPSRRSPSPVADQRVSLWKEENRAFNGTINRDRSRPHLRTDAARAAQRSALMINGQPQFVFFCDGSSSYMSTPNSTQDGGYAVVFRDPYGADKAATTRSFDSAIARIDLPGSQEQDGISVGDFTVRHWLSHRTFGAAHVEMAALAQALEEVIKRNDQHHSDKSTVKIFTDSDTALARIDRGILDLETNTFANSLKRKRENKAFFEEHTNPFVRLIVWQSHYLSDRGCAIEMNWMPRNTTLGHSLADHMAGKWKNWRGKDPGDAFNQNYLPRDQRDSIMDKLHEEVSAIERARTYNVLNPEPEEEPKPKQAEPPKKERRIKIATGAKKRSTTERTALLDSPSDYIPLDSGSEENLAPQSQPQKKKRKIEHTIKAPKRSTTDYILLDSDSDEEPQRPKKRRRVRRRKVKKTCAEDHTIPDSSSDYTPLDSDSEQEPKPKPKPKPQPPKKKQEAKGATTVRQRSTSDFILLDSDHEEQPKPKQPQTPKRRKKNRDVISVKKRAPTQQVEGGRLLDGEDNETGADGYLHGEDHTFTFDLGNLPAYPTSNQEHAIHDPDSGHGTPSCLLCACQDNDYPWRSGYTGLPSQWTLRRY